MSILISQNTNVIIQGITGKEGQKAVRAMLDYHTNVVGGVRPGKAGETVEGVPVFDSVKHIVEMLPRNAFPAMNGNNVSSAMKDSNNVSSANLHNIVSAIYVPPFAAKAAIMEAIDAGVAQINIIVERIPIKDTAYCLAAAREKNIQIIGPSSLGYIAPGIGRIGVVGGPKELADEIFTPGEIGIISRSGGMTNELSWQVRKAGLGQSTAVHVGGDLLMGTTYADLLRMFEVDEQTKAVLLFGEHGGNYEFEIVELIEQGEFTKPLAIYIGGKFANKLPEGMNIGHAGAIVERGKGATEKAGALRSVGVRVAETCEDMVGLVSGH